MNRLAIFFGCVIAGIGLVGVAAPSVLLEVSSFVLTESGLYAAAAFRIVMGVVLIVAAAPSRMPRTVRVLGVLILIGGIATPFLGVDRVRALVDWGSALGPMYMRAWAGLAVALGLFVIYAAGSRPKAA